MNTQEDYWWLVYGNFKPGTGNLPHFGNVVSTTWPLQFSDITRFANAYGCTVRYAHMLGSDKNVDHPKDEHKRRLLASILKVTPLLFGLPVLQEEGNKTVIEFISQQHMLAYEDVLAMSWQLYYTGDFLTATRNLALWLYMINNSVNEACGVGKDQLRSFQSKFLQLSATSLRDQGAMTAALNEGTKALKIARELGNPELIVSSLHHRFRIYVEREEWNKALIDVQETLQIVKNAEISPILKGTVYTDAGEAYAAVAHHGDPSLQQTALKYFDKAASLARTLPNIKSNDYLRFSISKVMCERAANVATFGMKREALDSIQIAYRTLAADNISWRRDCLLSSADIKLYIDEDVTGCYLDMLEAITLHETTNTKSNGPWMWRMHQKCQEIEPNNKYAPVVEQKLQTYK